MKINKLEVLLRDGRYVSHEKLAIHNVSLKT